MNIRLHTIAGCRKLICNMTLLVNEDNKQILIFDSGKGMAEVPKNISRITHVHLGRPKIVTPNFSILAKYLKQGYTIVGLIITHLHNDHLGSIVELTKYLESLGVKLTFKIYCSAVTRKLGLKSLKSSYFKENSEVLEPFAIKKITEDLKIYSFEVCHSAPQTMGIYCKMGGKKLLYLPDMKLDYDPVIGPSQGHILDLIEKLSKNVDGVVLESTTTSSTKPNITENEVRAKLRNLLSYYSDIKEGIIVTSFSTNAARILSIIEATIKSKRTLAVFGRAMQNCLNVFFEQQLIPEVYKNNVEFIDNINIVEKKKKKYVLLCSGHQGETNSALFKIVNGLLPYKLTSKDLVLFSSKLIPVLNCTVSRALLFTELLQRRTQVIDEVHTSGHINRQDTEIVVQRLSKAKKFFINHGDIKESVNYYAIFDSLKLDLSSLIICEDNRSYPL